MLSVPILRRGAASGRSTEPDRTQPDRYEPLPGLVELPRWLWRKMGRRSRIAVVAALLGAVVLAVALAPGIQESKLKRLLSEQREQAEHRAQLIRKFEAEQQTPFWPLERRCPSGRRRRRATGGAWPDARRAD
jgi:hypothetical protein